jgi:hypothetical protein
MILAHRFNPRSRRGWLSWPLQALGPAAGMMIDAQDLERIVANKVGNDERRFRNDELPRPGNTARMTKLAAAVGGGLCVGVYSTNHTPNA